MLNGEIGKKKTKDTCEKKKHILIVRNYPSYMDVKRNTYNIQELGLAKALVRKGYVCDIVLWTDREEETVLISAGKENQTVCVYYKKGITFLKNTIFINCKELFKKYDIIQTCEYNQIQSWILAGKYPEKIRIFHGPYYSEFNKRYNLMCKVFDILFLKRYQKNGTKFLAKSNMAKEFLCSKGILEENIDVCGVGIDVNMLSNRAQENTQTVYLDMLKHKEQLKLLYIGRLEQRRNIKFIFEVFRQVLALNSCARLYVIGNGETEYVEELWKYADKLQIRENIVWQKTIEQKYLSNIYLEADFFLLPTAYEIFGMVLLEAMYYENIVLTTYNGGSSMLITHEKDGFIIDELNAEKWANYIFNLNSNQNSKQIIQHCAHSRVANQYLWDYLTDKFEEAYFN